MRLVAIVLIAAGLYFGIVKPWFSTNFTGEELASIQIFDRNLSNSDTRGWQVDKVFLEKEKSPAIIRLNVGRIPGQFYNNGKLKLLVRVAPISPDGTSLPPILNEAVTVNLDDNKGGRLPADALETTHISTSEFIIAQTGNFRIGAFPIAAGNVSKGAVDLNIDRNITRISAVVMSGVEQVERPGSTYGLAMLALGIGLYFISRRRKSHPGAPVGNVTHRELTPSREIEVEPEMKAEPVKKSKPRKKPKTVPKTKVGKTIQWGRDAGKKRD